jgi:hypothetical protein
LDVREKNGEHNGDNCIMLGFVIYFIELRVLKIMTTRCIRSCLNYCDMELNSTSAGVVQGTHTTTLHLLSSTESSSNDATSNA